MAYKNPKDLLVDATKYPAAIEAKLPAGAPKISTMLLDAAGKIPAEIPDFLIEIPALPAPPEIPAFELPGGAGLKRYVSGVEVTPISAPVNARITREVIPSPAVGVIPEVKTRRGM
ncbi:MAG: hypothetical protein Q7J06_06555 [Bacteroidales bacterium]|nr:hypothetical protein [Bacteroidales bacterium]